MAMTTRNLFSPMREARIVEWIPRILLLAATFIPSLRMLIRKGMILIRRIKCPWEYFDRPTCLGISKQTNKQANKKANKHNKTNPKRQTNKEKTASYLVIITTSSSSIINAFTWKMDVFSSIHDHNWQILTMFWRTPEWWGKRIVEVILRRLWDSIWPPQPSCLDARRFLYQNENLSLSEMAQFLIDSDIKVT